MKKKKSQTKKKRVQWTIRNVQNHKILNHIIITLTYNNKKLYYDKAQMTKVKQSFNSPRKDIIEILSKGMTREKDVNEGVYQSFEFPKITLHPPNMYTWK